MSGSSGKNGVGLGRGIFRKVLGADRSTDRAAAEKQAVFDSTNNDDGFRAIPMHTAADPGIMELNKEGFVVYNLPEDNDIFVSRPGDKAFFEEDEPILIKVSTEDFGISDIDVNRDVKQPEVFEETVNVGLRPEQFFVHAMPRQAFDDIDFNEVIVKQHNEEEVEAPLADLGAKEEFVDAGMTNVSKPEEQKAMTCDGAVAEPICMHTINFTDEADIVEEVEESTDKGDFRMDTQGLHIEGAKNINSVESEDKVEYSTSFSGEIFKDLAVTSEAQERPATQLYSEVPADPVADIAVEIPTVESRSKIVEVYDVKDIVADVLKLTLPELNEDEMIVSDLPADIERNIPEDGLESFDAKFNLRVAKIAPVSSVAMDFGRKKIQTIGSSLNFTF